MDTIGPALALLLCFPRERAVYAAKEKLLRGGVCGAWVEEAGGECAVVKVSDAVSGCPASCVIGKGDCSSPSSLARHL
jgi:hypothetical protein